MRLRSIDRYRIVAFVAVVLVALAFVAWAAVFIRRTSFVAIDGRRYYSLFDDAMISMRYAWNLAHGAGPVWNPGERVEGYSNPLLVLLMAALSALMDQRSAVLAVQIGGVCTALATAAMATQVYRLLGERGTRSGGGRVPWLVFGAVLAYYPLTYFTLMGMETGLLALLLLIAVYLAILSSRSLQPRLFILLGGIFGLLFLTRADSTLFTAAIVLYICSSRRESTRSDPRAWRAPLTGLLVFVGFIVGERLFAYAYYGSLLPNTYLLKVQGVPLSVRLLNGVRYLRPYLGQSLPLLVLCLVETIFDARSEKLLLGAVPFVAIAYQVYVGGDPWPYWRIMAPSYPLLVVMAVTALEALAAAFAEGPSAGYYFYRRPLLAASSVLPLLTTLGLLPAAYLANIKFAGEIIGTALPYQVSDNHANVDTAIALREVTSPDATVGVFWGGDIPYYSGRTAVDFLGKSDPYIASLRPDLSGAISWSGISSVPGHNKYDLNYSIRVLRPTYIQGLSWGSQDLSEWGLQHYSWGTYKGVRLLLLNDSPRVFWARLGPGPAP